MKTALRNTLLLASLPAIALSGGSCSLNINWDGNSHSFDYEGAEVSRSLQGPVASDTDRIKVDNQFGEVHVIGSDDDFGWNWTLTAWADDEPTAERFLNETNLEMSQVGGKGEWKLHMPESDSDLRGLKSILVLKVPRQLEVEIDHTFGDTEVRDILGKVDADSAFGTLSATGLAGEVDLSNQYGELKATQIAGIVRLKNAFGKTEFEGRPIELECDSSYGETHLRVNGRDVESITADNSFGSITLEIPEGLDASVDFGTSFGAIHSTLEGGGHERNMHDQSVTGGSPSATVHLDLDTSYGDINVKTHSG